MQFREFFFPEIGQIRSLLYAFHHPIYQYIHRIFDPINIQSSSQEVKELLRKNITFTSSRLEHNHDSGDLCQKLKQRNKMDAPKGPISADTQRTNSRRID